MLQFSTLWAKHPANQVPPVQAPCLDKDGQPAFANQCAIRMSVCILDSGGDLNNFRGVFCWHGHGRRHVLRAEELASFLRGRTDMVGTVEIETAPTLSKYQGRKGIALFKNFWGPGNQGDHIDVWRYTVMAQGSPDYFALSQEVWFWELD